MHLTHFFYRSLLKTTVITILLLGLVRFAVAQQYYFKSYSLDEGLPQSEIFAGTMLQDSRGHIWVGSNGGGLARLSGNRFEVFDRNDGFSHNQIWGLHEDSKGRIWATTFNKGLSCYNGQTVRNYIDEDSIMLNTPNFAMSFEETTSDGRFWATPLTPIGQRRLLVLEPGEDIFRKLPVKGTALENIRPLNMLKAPDGTLYLNTALNDTVFYYNTDKKTFLKSDLPVYDSTGQVGTFQRLLIKDSKGRPWFFYADGTSQKLLLYENNTFRELNMPAPTLPGAITGVTEDLNGNLWFTFLGSLGVVKYDGEKFIRITKQNGLPSNTISDVMCDREGTVWLSTRGSGLLKMSSERFTNYTTDDGLAGPLTASIYQDKDSVHWIGSFNNGFARFKDGLFKRFNTPRGLARTTSFYEEDNDHLLVGTFGGIFRFNKKTEQLTPVNPEFGIPPGIGINNIVSKGNKIYICSNQGIFISDKETGENTNWNVNNVLPNNLVRDIKFDSKGVMWITSNGGLTRYDRNEFKVFDEKDGISTNLLLQLYIDRYDNVWMITYGRGLNVYDGENFITYTEKNGLSSSITYSITDDSEGNIWVGTQNGVDKLIADRAGLLFGAEHFSKKDGILGNEMNGMAAFRDKEGNLWFGHLNGVLRYNPDKDQKNTTKPIVYINDLKLFFEETDWQSGKEDEDWEFDSLSRWFNIPQNLVLPHNRNHFTFRFFSTAYRSQEKVLYEWQIENLDEKWLRSFDKHEVTYSSIPPGTYTFRVKARNESGVVSDEVTFKFRILPPYWESWWFRVLVAILILSLIAAGVYWRFRVIEAKRKQLEHLVEQRTKEVVEQKDQILAKNAELEQQQEEILSQHEEIEDKNSKLEKLYNEVQGINSDLTASINYAKRLQEAMLVPLSRIRRELDDAFVLYKPRNIVSGDFYWFVEHERYIFIAAVDCTGHGVPGAFMSIAGDAYLNQIVNQQRIYAPSEILNELHQHIRKALKQETSNNRDGMDAALCVIDKHERKLRYAGARNPLVFASDGELKLIKGDRLSVGGEEYKGPHRFAEHELDLSKVNPETVFYLYSDGYQDQFGGPNCEKLKSQVFRKLLLKYHELPLHQQKSALKRFLNEWQGYESQIDDILVIGFKCPSKLFVQST